MKRKKLLFIVLALLLSGQRAHAYDFEVNGIYYNLNTADRTAIVTRNYDKPYVGDIVIPDEVVYNTRSLKVVEIGDGAFSGCDKLVSVKIGKNVTTIGDGAFSDCHALKEVVIPANVMTIKNGTFFYYGSPFGLKNVTKLVLEDSKEELTTGWSYKYDYLDYTHICYGAFDNAAFPNLKEVYIGRNFTTVTRQSYMFSETLQSVEIGPYVTNAEYFAECTNITKVRSYILDPSKCTINFENAVFAGAELTVPQGTKAAYESAYGWSNFFNVVEAGGTFSLMVSATAGGAVMYDGTTVSGGAQSFTVDSGSDAMLTIVPNAGFELERLTVNGMDVTGYVAGDGTYTLSNLNEDTQVSVSFVQQTATLTILMADQGTVTQQILMGQSYRFLVAAQDGWTLHSVTFNDADMTGQVTSSGFFTTPVITDNSTLYVAFEQTEETAVHARQASPIRVQATSSGASITGTKSGDIIRIYTADGTLQRTLLPTGSSTEISLPTCNVYLIKAGSKTVKIRL